MQLFVVNLSRKMIYIHNLLDFLAFILPHSKLCSILFVQPCSFISLILKVKIALYCFEGFVIVKKVY